MVPSHKHRTTALHPLIPALYHEFMVDPCTRYRDKKVVRCITNVSEEVVHLRGNNSKNKCFLLGHATDKGKY